MTEAAQVFNQTVGERSKQKNSAYHKKNGSAVAKLGNKRMSWQEINSKHGKEETYPSTDGFMDYASFEKLPSDLKIEFINKLMDKYDIGLQHISRHLFNKGDDGLKANLRNNFDILDKIDYKKARANSGLLKFRDEVEEWKLREKAAKAADEAEAQRKRGIIWKGEFISYDEFKTFPADGQVAYLNNLIKKYSISASTVAKVLFQITQPALRSHLEKLNVYGQLEKSKVGNSKTSVARVAAFEKAVKKWRGKTVVEEPKTEAEVTPETAAPVEEPKDDILVPSIPENVLDGEKRDLAVDTYSGQLFEFNPEDAEKTIEEVEKQINQVQHIATVSDFLEAIKTADSVVEEVPSVQSHEMSFSANYISENGLDEKQLFSLMSLFSGKKVKVNIIIQSM